MKSTRNALLKALQSTTGLDAEVVDKNLVTSEDASRGDFAFPCFAIAKSKKVAPPQCAQELAQAIILPSEFERVEVVGPYLNFFLDRATMTRSVINEILRARTRYGSGEQTKRVIVEYSSPNIAKPFHVGHLRTTLIGHVLDRMYRHLGYDVIGINHLGDWGTQFGFVYVGCELWGKPADESVDALVEVYRKATALRKSQEAGQVPPHDADKPDVNSLARDYFLRLEAGDEKATKFWRWCVDISVDYLNTIYARLGVRFDHITGESFYRPHLAGVEQALKESGILQNDAGALGVDLGKPLGFVRIFTEDGRSLYMTRDLATADYRMRTYKPDKILIVVAAPQKLYFQQLIGVLDRWKHPAADKIVHVAYGQIPGVSTRGGSSVAGEKFTLRELIDEAHERAREAYESLTVKKPEGIDQEKVAESVGLGAVFFNYLCRGNTKDFNFRWEDALNFQGDTGPYIQYALARLSSLEERALASGVTVGPDWDASKINDPQCYSLVHLLAHFPAAIEHAAAEYEPHHLALHTLRIAKEFSSLYHDARVVGEAPAIAEARLALFQATKYALTVGLTLLGIPVVERM